ncbi:alkaline phosphatase family protein [Tenuibacillus multivorans]|uniref:Type I phosphodiesterase / nucleotide pyrophosphatase n=1 Tax=Tenuibacillus multivorans TaxID=237069 RepID=A0A1H0CP05_9BACI|nr:alkaline phosphatase family protein [Tenuibacillus multivorans]GEL76223.1 hypothetical protein TMU01_04580 [Tenuibacillus multivorans]SDN59599.1 Type I phosphodiesterase / nucleotide pyrophosphatase [Tenuibacillus multivorans]
MPETNHKPVILLNIDSLLADPLEKAIQKGKAPALKFLKENGNFTPNMVSSFPTMSVTIDSSLFTGTYTDQHQVPALNWYDENKREMVNYGTGFRETIRIGFSQSMRNMFHRLNNIDLSKNVKTIFEELDEYGHKGASINSFVYRGKQSHDLTVPKFVQAITNLDDKITTNAPYYLSLGAFSSFRKPSFAPFMIGGNRKFAGRELRYLIKNNLLPSFTFCIFQDMDVRVHFKRPYDISGISKIDKEIQKTLNLYDSWEEAIDQNIWMVIGDNGQAPQGWNFNDVLINLRKILKDYRIHKIQDSVTSSDQLVISVNQRMAYVYVLDKELPISRVVSDLRHDRRIDVIAWKEEAQNVVVSGSKEGELRFAPEGHVQDIYGQNWDLDGDLAVLDIDKMNQQKITYNDYPDVLARLHGALHSHSGRFIVINAKPGCEFIAQSTPYHLGGASHGSLHKQESSIPFLITGADIPLENSRIIDIKSFILNLILRTNG